MAAPISPEEEVTWQHGLVSDNGAHAQAPGYGSGQIPKPSLHREGFLNPRLRTYHHYLSGQIVHPTVTE